MNDWLLTDAHHMLSTRAWSAFEVEVSCSSIAATFDNGQLGWNAGNLGDSVRGQHLALDR